VIGAFKTFLKIFRRRAIVRFAPSLVAGELGSIHCLITSLLQNVT